MRRPAWSGEPEVRVNGRRIKATATDGYIAIDRRWRAGDRLEVRYPMSLRVEATPDDPSRAAVCYGPVVLAGLLGTEGMQQPAPFSDPTVRNDYYTYDYHIPAGLKTSMNLDPADPARTLRRDGTALRFTSAEGDTLVPLYDAHRCRYVVYWQIP